MHIVILTPTFFPNLGGTEQTVYQWAVRLARRHTVSVVTYNHTKSPKREMYDGLFEVYRISIRSMSTAWVVPNAALAFLQLLRIELRDRIDVIHHGHVFYMGLGVTLFKLLFGKPVVNTLLGRDTYDPILPIPGRYNWFMAFIMNSADTVVTMTRHMAESAKRQGCKKDIAIIPHGSNLPERVEPVLIREKHSVKKSAKIIFSLQRLDPRKGLAYLIGAVPDVIKDFSDAIFIIGGTGPEEGMLKNLCETLGAGAHVVFAGFIPDNELVSYYDQSDLFALPTLYEGFGIVYVDAMSRGLPIVTTATGGALDIVTEETGILVPPKDSPALAAGIKEALKRSWSREKIKKLSKRYNWDVIVGKYERIYNSLTGVSPKDKR